MSNGDMGAPCEHRQTSLKTLLSFSIRSLSVALAAHRLQCYSKLYTKELVHLRLKFILR